MPHISGCQQLLDALSSARQQLELQIYVDIFWQALAEVDSGSSDSDFSFPLQLQLTFWQFT
jgi:hypothetical protein